MTNEEIMAFARAAGVIPSSPFIGIRESDFQALKKYTELATRKERIARKAAQIENELLKDVLAGAAMKERRAVWVEREACAAIAEDQDTVTYSHGGKLYDDGRATITAIANTIRARGQRDV